MPSQTPLGIMSLRASVNALPQAVADVQAADQRGDSYGAAYVNALSSIQAAQDGSLFVLQNATAGTAIAQTANTTQDTTKPFIVMFNNAPSGTGKSMIPLWLRMKAVNIQSGQTTQNIDIITCAGNAYSSAGTDYSSKATGIGTAGWRSPNSALTPSTVASVIRVGVPVTVLGSDSRQLVHAVPRATVIPVAGDQYVLKFGAFAGDVPDPSMIISGTSAQIVTINCPPVIVGPQTSMMVIPWAASVAGAMTWEFEMVWVER